jgi:hypothetical protein
MRATCLDGKIMVWIIPCHSLAGDHIKPVECEHCGGIQGMGGQDWITQLKSGGRNVSAGLAMAHPMAAAELSCGKS